MNDDELKELDERVADAYLRALQAKRDLLELALAALKALKALDSECPIEIGAPGLRTPDHNSSDPAGARQIAGSPSHSANPQA